MKKRFLRELMEAYNNELVKRGVLDAPVEESTKTLAEMTKAELIEEGNKLNITLDMKQTKAEMIAAIECYNEPVEEEIVVNTNDIVIEEINTVEEVPTIENVEEALERIKESAKEEVQEVEETIEEGE